MSSKQQFKDTLKREKQTLTSLKKEVEVLKESLRLRELIISKQREHIDILREELKKKPWWKFWR